ncbi:hypothetical protein WOLCODRAFT_140139 [Wolfiporia cocos MD-104 SS10]|uniref:Synaptobrevin n=1 Tax=Wolfiporia cocos (strain MD-104) TaxID=742152 RepID=A0A2H3J128_WOLCO|nr:hypothetical protein WOLCODRAFT_140139 [Wolfiporia cocos MD-104 SS10]
MESRALEQATHDKVNLTRLVRKLEKTVADEDWNASGMLPPNAWIKTRTTLQKLKYARKLLNNVEMLEDDPESLKRYGQLRKLLERLESIVTEADQHVKPVSKGSSPLLPTLPLPVLPSPKPIVTLSESPIPAQPGQEPISSDVITSAATQDLLLSPSDTETALRSNPSAILLPPNLPTSPAVSSDISPGAPAFLQNSAAIQEELSAQLAEMATQLRRNAVHFAGALEKDKTVVLEAQEKLERNYDAMSRERIRVRDHRSKSWGTTGIVLLSIVIALVGFIMTFFVIRFT